MRNFAQFAAAIDAAFEGLMQAVMDATASGRNNSKLIADTLNQIKATMAATMATMNGTLATMAQALAETNTALARYGTTLDKLVTDQMAIGSTLQEIHDFLLSPLPPSPVIPQLGPLVQIGEEMRQKSGEPAVKWFKFQQNFQAVPVGPPQNYQSQLYNVTETAGDGTVTQIFNNQAVPFDATSGAPTGDPVTFWSSDGSALAVGLSYVDDNGNVTGAETLNVSVSDKFAGPTPTTLGSLDQIDQQVSDTRPS
jgi:hypothetical protein